MKLKLTRPDRSFRGKLKRNKYLVASLAANLALLSALLYEYLT